MHKKLLLSLLVGALLCISVIGIILAFNWKRGGTVIHTTQAYAMDELLDQQMQQHAFSGSVCIIDNGKAVLRKGYGPANPFAPNKPSTTFRLASLTKTLTAAAVMRLVEQGKLDPNRPISDYLSFIKDRIATLKKDPANAEQAKYLQSITIAQLLNHTSGLKDFADIWPKVDDPWLFAPHAQKEIIEKLNALPIAFEPGSQRRYTNFGYFLIALILEKISGKSYSDVMTEEVFKPLKMTHTTTPSTPEDDHADAQPYTIGKFQNATDKTKLLERSPTATYDPYVRMGGGNAISNVRDLSKFAEAMMHPGFLSQKSLDAMRTQGYGWDLIGKVAEAKILPADQVTGKRGWTAKTGGLPGCHTVMWCFPDTNSAIIILDNTDMEQQQFGAIEPLSAEIGKLLFDVNRASD